MKIVFISRLFLPHLGGVEIHLQEIANILHRQGHEVSIITGQHDKKLGLVSKKKKYTVYRIPFDALTSKQKTWSAIAHYTELFELADVIHVHDVFWWMAPLYLKLRKKLYITFHGWETKFPIQKNAKIHRLFAAVLSQGTIHVGEFIQNFYWDKPNLVTYGGINPKRFTKSTVVAKNKGKKLEFVFIGRLEVDTAVPKYLALFQRLKEKKIPFSVTWIGDGSYRSECEKYGMVTGFIKNISKYIRFADFVCASSYLSILEAQLLGKIVLAFNSNPLKKIYLETYPGSQHMLVSDSVETMVKKLSHVLKSTKLRTTTESAAKQFAASQSWEKVVSKYLHLWGYIPESFQISGSISSKSTVPVSIVLTVLNESETIQETLLSLLNQTVLPKEILVVDGGSTDETVQQISEIFSEYKKEFKRLVSLQVLEKKGNRSVGRNTGIQKATQDCIAITDAGCVVDSNWLENLFAKHQESKVPVIAGYYQGLPKTKFESAVVPYVLVMPDRVNPNDFLPATRSVLLSKDIFDNYGYFPEEFSDNEDYVFFNRLRSRGVQMGFAADAIVYWKPRSDLKSFYTMIYRFARGDIQAKLFRPKVFTVFARYLFFIFLFPIFPLYLLWAIYKNKKYVGYGWIYLPILQVVSDFAVMHGTIVGYFRLFKKLFS